MAVGGPSLVLMSGDSDAAVDLVLVVQYLARRTNVGVARGVVSKASERNSGGVPRRSKLRAVASGDTVPISPPNNSTPHSAAATTVSRVMKPPSTTT